MRWLGGVVLASVLVKLVLFASVLFARPDAAQAEAATSAAPAAQGGVLPADLVARSQGLREILAAVQKRQEELDAREKAMAARETGIAQLERAVAAEVTRLEALTGGGAAGAKKPGAPGKPGATADQPPGVTRIYESMKAEDAAGIFDKLDDDTLRAILGHMKERQIGAILAAMTRERAVAVTKLLAANGQKAPKP